MWLSTDTSIDADGNVACRFDIRGRTRAEYNEILASYEPPADSSHDESGGSVEDSSRPGVHLTAVEEVLNGG